MSNEKPILEQILGREGSQASLVVMRNNKYSTLRCVGDEGDIQVL